VKHEGCHNPDFESDNPDDCKEQLNAAHFFLPSAKPRLYASIIVV
jgi:hypothetical protein